jgi:hypothetical protein
MTFWPALGSSSYEKQIAGLQVPELYRTEPTVPVIVKHEGKCTQYSSGVFQYQAIRNVFAHIVDGKDREFAVWLKTKTFSH